MLFSIARLLPELHPWPAVVPVDELDAGGLEGRLDGIDVPRDADGTPSAVSIRCTVEMPKFSGIGR